MDCPHCHFSNPAGTTHCRRCHAPLESEGPTLTDETGRGQPLPLSAGVVLGDAGSQAALQTGSVLAGRYEILQMIGKGGMGAVYKARDRELDRQVALKVIRPELAEQPQILQRFKQELILARQVTHKNVVRIFDLGEAGATKFITMEYVEGQDLKTLLRQKGKFSPNEAVSIVQQVGRALNAAHAEGVIHRDLKPQNLMLDKQGKVTVMDFGIARSMEMPGLTQTGALVGTLEYMSPEQVKGEELDQRSDLFALGIIFYELLTGKLPYQADSAVSTLVKRTQERASLVTKLDPSIPLSLSDVVAKCLEIDRRERYQSALEILRDLEARQTGRAGAAVLPSPLQLAALYWKWMAVPLAATLLAAMGLFVFWENIFPAAPVTQKPVTLLVADFDNATGDPVFEGTLEPALTLALEGASFIAPYNRGQARKVAAELRPGANRLDQSLARLIAVREGINVVVAGSIASQGGGYKISIWAIDAADGKPIVQSTAEGADKGSVLGAVSKLGARLRRGLGDTTPESVQLAAAETFTAASLEAAQSYAVAQEFQWAGKWDDAIRAYERAAALDPNLGRAYAGLAAVHANLGKTQEAEKYYQLAMARIDRMTDREKYRTRGGYYLLVRNPQKAVEEFSALVKQYPADSAGHANLALAYFYRREMAQALAEGRQAVEISPKNVLQRNNVALYAMYAGDFETAAREAQAVLELNPAFVKAYVALALSQLAQGQLEAAAETYRRLEAVSPRGASYAAAGLTDLALYEGRAGAASAILEKGVEVDLANKSSEAAANKMATLALIHLARGRARPALASVEQALATSRETGVAFTAAHVYLGAGRDERARGLAAELGARLEPEHQVYAKLIEGEWHLARGRAREAVKAFQEAQNLADTWLGRFNLGRAYLEAGAFTEAYSEFDICLKRRGEATAVFLDDVPSYHHLPPVYYYLGRAQEGLKSPAAAESYKTFLAIKEKGDEDPLVADARRRLGSP